MCKNQDLPESADQQTLTENIEMSDWEKPDGSRFNVNVVFLLFANKSSAVKSEIIAAVKNFPQL